MGKGYNNFMSKKAFHPGSHANQKRIQEAEEKAAAKKKQEEERIARYRKEQEELEQRRLVSKGDSARFEVSFIYDQPSSSKATEQNDDKPMKWKRDAMHVKQEPKKEKKPKREPEDSSSSEEEIVLKWSRDEPRTKKKVKTEK